MGRDSYGRYGVRAGNACVYMYDRWDNHLDINLRIRSDTLVGWLYNRPINPD